MASARGRAVSPACATPPPPPPRPLGASNSARRLSTCCVTSRACARPERGSIGDSSRRVSCSDEQTVGERKQNHCFAAHFFLPIEQRELVLQIVVEQHVVDASFLRELVEVQLAQPRPPPRIERRACGVAARAIRSRRSGGRAIAGRPRIARRRRPSRSDVRLINVASTGTDACGSSLVFDPWHLCRRVACDRRQRNAAHDRRAATKRLEIRNPSGLSDVRQRQSANGRIRSDASLESTISALVT